MRALRGGTRKLDPSDLFKGELSLMGCAGSRFSEAMVNAWLDGVAGTSGAAGAAIEGDRAKGEGDHILGAGGVSEAAAAAVCDTGGSIGGGSAPSVRILRLALVEGAILSWLRLPLLASMRVTVPAAQRDSFFVCFGDTSESPPPPCPPPTPPLNYVYACPDAWPLRHVATHAAPSAAARSPPRLMTRRVRYAGCSACLSPKRGPRPIPSRTRAPLKPFHRWGGLCRASASRLHTRHFILTGHSGR